MRFILFIAVVFLLFGRVGAQTTQPATESKPAVRTGGAAQSNGVPAAWARTVSSIAAAAAARDSDALQALAPANCTIQKFSGERDTDSSGLVDFVAGEVVLGDHAYLFPQSTIATDVAADVTGSPAVPEAAKKGLALDEKNGQSVALRWVGQTLEADDGTPIGIIVCWNARSDSDDQQRPDFILIKGARDGEGFRVTSIVYGDPLQ